MAKMKERPEQSTLDDMGREIPDSVPMAPPIGYKREPTMAERIRSMVRSEHLRLAAEAAGAETFEEADDFDVGDDYDPSSPYEEVFDPVDEETRRRLRDDEFRASVEARLNEARPNRSNNDGSISADERGSSDLGSSVGHADKEPKGKSKPKQNATNERSVADADRDVGEAKV